jgi:hypothetical protein
MAVRGLCGLSDVMLGAEMSALLDVVEDAPTVRDLREIARGSLPSWADYDDEDDDDDVSSL